MMQYRRTRGSEPNNQIPGAGSEPPPNAAAAAGGQNRWANSLFSGPPGTQQEVKGQASAPAPSAYARPNTAAQPAPPAAAGARVSTAPAIGSNAGAQAARKVNWFVSVRELSDLLLYVAI